MSKKIILLLLILFITSIPLCMAESQNDNSMIAVALYIDTSGYYIPGTDFLNKALNEAIRIKMNLLFLSSQVQSGTPVLNDLSRSGITSTSTATLDSLSTYAQMAHVNYVMLFTIHPLDVSVDLKAFSTSRNAYIIDKSIARPKTSADAPLADAFTEMINNELSDVFNIMKKDLASEAL